MSAAHPTALLRSLFRGLRGETQRRFRAYGVGMPKSGTQSLARVCERRYRSAHEPYAEQLIEHVVAAAADPGRHSGALADFVRRAEREYALEMNSSQLNVHVLDQLVGEDSRSLFILTLRDCYTWLDSYYNHHLSEHAAEGKRRLRYLRHRPDLHPHRPEERALAERGLFSVDGCLSFWSWHVRTVLDAVPPSRLLVVRTGDFASNLPAVAGFLGVPEASLDRAAAHSHRAERRFHLVGGLDRSFLEDRVQEHCGALMAQWFPEIRSISDTGLAS